MITEFCCCGNVVAERSAPVAFTIRRSPCACAVPGDGPGQLPSRDLPSWVSERQFRQRRALGLPVVTPLERAVSFKAR